MLAIRPLEMVTFELILENFGQLSTASCKLDKMDCLTKLNCYLSANLHLLAVYIFQIPKLQYN